MKPKKTIDNRERRVQVFRMSRCYEKIKDYIRDSLDTIKSRDIQLRDLQNTLDDTSKNMKRKLLV